MITILGLKGMPQQASETKSIYSAATHIHLSTGLVSYNEDETPFHWH